MSEAFGFVGELRKVGEKAGAAAVVCAVVAMGLDSAAQEIGALGMANVFFGAKLGLLQLDWGQIGQFALGGAVGGGIGGAVGGVVGGVRRARGSIADKLRSRKLEESAPFSGAPKGP